MRAPGTPISGAQGWFPVEESPICAPSLLRGLWIESPFNYPPPDSHMLGGGQGLHSGYPPPHLCPGPGRVPSQLQCSLSWSVASVSTRACILWPRWGLPMAPRPPNTRPFPSQLLTSIPTPLAAFNPVHGGTDVDPNRTAHDAGVPEENDLIFRLGLGAEWPFWGGSLPAGEEIIKAALPGFLREPVALKRRLMRERERQAQSLGTPGSLSLPQGHPLPDGEKKIWETPASHPSNRDPGSPYPQGGEKGRIVLECSPPPQTTPLCFQLRGGWLSPGHCPETDADQLSHKLGEGCGPQHPCAPHCAHTLYGFAFPLA